MKKTNPFKAALQGLKWFAQTQWNAKVHSTAALLVLFAGFYFKINKLEWILITLCISIVFITELLNTAIEFALNKLHPDYDSFIGKSKDVSAAAVLIASICSVVVGIIVFQGYVRALF